MAATDATFGHSISEHYHRYLVPLIFDDYARDLAARVRVPAGARVLELACGTGALTRHLRELLPGNAGIVATDLSPGMVAAAQANLPVREGIDFRTVDGTRLPFADDTFDAVVCQFGVMFFEDKSAGYREAARVLKPGGAFVFNVWDSHERNHFCDRVHRKVVELFPDDPPAFLETPFAYHDLSTIKAELQAAGFGHLEVAVLPGESRAPSARDVALGFVAGSPLAGQLAAQGVERDALEAVEAALVEEFGHDEVRAPMQSIAIVARSGGE